MNADQLLDAFGMIDDRFITPEESDRIIPWRRRLAVLAAAVLIIAMSILTAMAASEGFRDFVFSVFTIETQDLPPATEQIHPTEPGLHEMDTVTIDGAVTAMYFSSGGFLTVCDGGFYTSQWPEEHQPPEAPAFWEIRLDGIAEAAMTRVDFPFTYAGKTFRILFDCAVLNDALAIRVWPVGQDSVGSSWNVQPLGNRTDAVLLTIPVLSGNACTHDLFLLELETLEATPLITGLPILADGYWVTEDLHYAIAAGHDPETDVFSYWLWDLQTKTITTLAETVTFAWFLNEKILVYREIAEDGSIDLIRFHIPSGVQDVLLEKTSSDDYRPIRNHRADGRHGLLFREDGTVELMDFQTKEILHLTGLDPTNLTCDESPDGSRIMLGHKTEDGFSSLGILDTETGVLKLLERKVSGCESFAGWLDNDTLVITAHETPDADLHFTPGDGYYVYVYRFQEEIQAPTVPISPEPADDAFVRVADYIPDIAVDLRYAGQDNFTGQTIYNFSDAWLRYGTVKKLMAVQAELRTRGLRLKIWDGFRPTSAQFQLWEVCPDSRYVANPNHGFSSHSRGGTVDVTLVYSDGRELPMPTGFDDFSSLADRDYSDCTPEAAANARYLEHLMEKHGFKPYSAEWWHYTDTQTYPVEENFQPT